MPKKKERTPDEHFKGQIRELEKEIRRLRQQLRQYEKYERSQEDDGMVKDSEDTYASLPKLHKCQSDSCGKGVYVEIELLGRTYGTCNVCNERKRLK